MYFTSMVFFCPIQRPLGKLLTWSKFLHLGYFLRKGLFWSLTSSLMPGLFPVLIIAE
jgi:hypothetical protein